MLPTQHTIMLQDFAGMVLASLACKLHASIVKACTYASHSVAGGVIAAPSKTDSTTKIGGTHRCCLLQYAWECQ